MVLTGFAEADEDDATDDPRSKARGVRKVDKPVENYVSLGTNVQIRQKGEAAAGHNGVNGQTIPVAPREDPRSVPGDGERVQRSTRHVEECVSRGPSTAEDSSIYDGRENGDTGVSNSNNPRGSVGVASTRREAFSIGNAGDANC